MSTFATPPDRRTRRRCWFFQSVFGLSPATVVADIGSGTGMLTEHFVRNGNFTFAVEPNAAMRRSAEQRLGQWPNFKSINATAEATTLADTSVGLITVGQAFHWFEPDRTRVEFHRILKPGGHVALVWNVRMHDRSPFMRGHQDLLERFQATRRWSTSEDDAAMYDRFFGAGKYQSHTFDNPQSLNRQGLLDQIRSSSFTPMPPHPDHDRIIDGAGELFDAHQIDGLVKVQHETQVYVGTL